MLSKQMNTESVYENINPNRLSSQSNNVDSLTPRKKSIRLSGSGISSTLSPPIALLPANRLSLISVNSDDSFVTATDCMDTTPLMNRKSMNVMSPGFGSISRKTTFLNSGMTMDFNSHELLDRVANLERQLIQKEKEIDQLKLEKDELRKSFEEVSAVRSMEKDELSSTKFFCSLQEQKISEIEHHISTLTLQHNESVSDKTKKYKAVISRLKDERQQYEQRANAMVTELQSQMSQLQVFAMQRIEHLEQELMGLRHKNQELECFKLKHFEEAALDCSFTSMKSESTCTKSEGDVEDDANN